MNHFQRGKKVLGHCPLSADRGQGKGVEPIVTVEKKSCFFLFFHGFLVLFWKFWWLDVRRGSFPSPYRWSAQLVKPPWSVVPRIELKPASRRTANWATPLSFWFLPEAEAEGHGEEYEVGSPLFSPLNRSGEAVQLNRTKTYCFKSYLQREQS